MGSHSSVVRLTSALLFATALVAQEPIDLNAVANVLVPANAPRPATDLLDAEQVQWAREVLDGTSLAERDALLDSGRVTWNGFALKLALGLDAFALAAADANPANALRLLQAAALLREADRLASEVARMLGVVGLEKELSPPKMMPLARQVVAAARYEAARLLRSSPPDPVIGRILMLYAEDVGERWPAPAVLQEAFRRRGGEATRLDGLEVAREKIHGCDVAGARAAMTAAMQLPRSDSVAAQLAEIRANRVLAEVIGFAEQQATGEAPQGLAKDIARLRLLQRVDAEAAVAMSRTLVAAKAEHALPHAILALDALRRGDRRDGLGCLERAAALPGRDATLAAGQVVMRVLPALARLRDTGPEADELREKVLAEMDDAAALFAAEGGVGSEMLQHFRVYRAWPMKMDELKSGALADAEAIRARTPESLDAQRLLLFEAFFAADRDRGRQAALVELPPALADAGDVHCLRASTVLALDLLLDRPCELKAWESVLAPLERAPGCAAQAAFLRGVRKWWEGHGKYADEGAQRATATAFAGELPPLGTPLHWEALCARAVADMQVRGEPAIGEVFGLRHYQDPDREPVGLLPGMIGRVRLADAKAVSTKNVEGWADQLDDNSSSAALFAELARFHVRAGDGAKAVACAKRALQWCESRSGSPSQLLRLGGGVVLSGAMVFRIGNMGVRPAVRLEFGLRFWVIPPGPDEAELQRIAQPPK